jgi:hypothetical protein
VLIDYLVGAAIAITGMLALLVFGTEIVRLNSESRDRWQARSALADFEGRWQVSGEGLPLGAVCQQSKPMWLVEWCESSAVRSLPDVTATVDDAAKTVSLSWRGYRKGSDHTLSVTRRLSVANAR